MDKTKGTIALDFDGVVHRYSQGYLDGSIYDLEIKGVFESIRSFMEAGYAVVIISTRSPRQIKKWLDKMCQFHDFPDGEIVHKFGFRCQVVPIWSKFWDKKDVLGITNRKLPALIYVDDRAFRFQGDWSNTREDVLNLI